MIDDFTDAELDQHWVPIGELVVAEVIGTHSELEPILLSYWYSIFPDADSVDYPMESTTNGLYDRYSIVASVTWSPQHMIGGTTSQLGVLTIGSHTFIAEPPDLHARMGWLLHGKASDREGAVGDFLIDLFGKDTPIPDRIATDVPSETVRTWLKSILDRHDLSDHFGWHALAEKVKTDPADREATLDRYVAGHVRS